MAIGKKQEEEERRLQDSSPRNATGKETEVGKD
jgi:hypothetical protein